MSPSLALRNPVFLFYVALAVSLLMAGGVVLAVILAIPVVRNRAHGQLPLLALAILGFVYFGWMFGHLAFLANSADAYSYLGYLVLGVELNDVAAYTCGKLFGRH